MAKTGAQDRSWWIHGGGYIILIIRKFAFTLTMIAFLAGCSSVRVIGFPGLENIPDGPQGEEMEPLKTGMDIKINLKTGESIEGRVVQFDLESVTIGNPSNYGTKASVVAFEEVESMTAEWGPYVSPFAILAGAVVGVVLTLYISLRMNLQSMN